MPVTRYAIAVLTVFAVAGFTVTLLGLFTILFGPHNVWPVTVERLHYWFTQDVFHLALVLVAIAALERLARK